jgi:hypothetical protein
MTLNSSTTWPWALLAAAIVLTVIALPAGVVALGIVAIVAHVRGLDYLRLAAVLVFLGAVLVLALGGSGGSAGGGLIDNQ